MRTLRATLMMALAALAACGNEPAPGKTASATAEQKPRGSASARTTAPSNGAPSTSAASPASSASTAPASATVEEACAALSAAKCARFERCDHAYRVKYTYGDLDGCKAAVKTSCMDALQAPDVAAGPSEIAACTAAVGQAACDLHDPPACRFKGKRPADKGCTVDAQCQSGICFRTADTKECGTCLREFAEGDACTTDSLSDCDPDLGCIDKKCAKRQPAGSVCKTIHGCDYGNTCENGKCTPAPKEGGACDTEENEFCHFAYGCDGKKCSPRKLAAIGEKCAFGQGPFCMKGTCERNTMTCKALPADGEECDAAKPCAEPYRCLGKKCGLPGKAACE